MPKSKRHFIKKRYNKSRKTKRGGGTPPNESPPNESPPNESDASEIEEGRKYGEISVPALYDPKKFDIKSESSSRLTSYTPRQTATFFEERETASREYDKLMRQHQAASEKAAEREKVQKSFLTPFTAQQTEDFFATANMNDDVEVEAEDEADQEECEGNSCNIMGGRKSRRKRRKGRKGCKKYKCKTHKRRKYRR